MALVTGSTNLIRLLLGVVGYTGNRGTVSAPAISFEEDQDTGIYSSGANTLDFSVGGVNVQSLAAISGDTGLSTTSGVRVYRTTGLITPTATTSASVVEQTFTITGLATNDTIIGINPPTTVVTAPWFIAGYRVSAANTLAIAFGSITGTPTPPAGVWRIAAVRSAT